MIDRAQWKRWLTHPIVDWTVFVVGVLLILLSPVVGALPGPGGIFVLALGLAMVLRTSSWARRRYVAFKKWQPKAGRWTDWGLRRKSAQRRETIRKEREAIGCPPPADELEEGPIAAILPGPPAKPPGEVPGLAAESRGSGGPGN
jgi:hypothetical protein